VKIYALFVPKLLNHYFSDGYVIIFLCFRAFVAYFDGSPCGDESIFPCPALPFSVSHAVRGQVTAFSGGDGGALRGNNGIGAILSR
jgi:hypothetical protein